MKKAILLSLALLAGCAQRPMLPVQPGANIQARPNMVSPQLSTRSYAGVRQGVITLRKVRFEKWDSNRDGILDRREVSDANLTIPDVISGFGDYDTNKDNLITLDEFLRDDVIHWWMTQYRMVTDGEFDLIDDNDDQVISGPELADTQAMFARWPELKGGDINGDGKVSYSEFEDTYMKVYQYIPR